MHQSGQWQSRNDIYPLNAYYIFLAEGFWSGENLQYSVRTRFVVVTVGSNVREGNCGHLLFLFHFEILSAITCTQ